MNHSTLRSRKLKVAINSSCLYPSAVGGWARYTSSLIESLKKYHSDDVELCELWNESGVVHSRWEQLDLPRTTRKRSIDLLHAPANGGVPLFGAKPSVLTVHDLFSEEDFSWRNAFRSAQDLKQALRYKVDWWISIRKCQKIIAVSEFTKGQLIQSGIPEEKVKVILEGISPEIVYTTQPFENLLPQSYIVYVGTTAPRKRVEQLVQKFTEFESKLKLVIVGPVTQPDYTKHPSIIYRSTLLDKELSALYSNALCFVTFSEKEGFGLPLVEAMACATPVFYTGGGSIAEVVGDGGIKINETELALALEAFMSSPGRRELLKTNAVKQAAKFSWEVCAAQTLDLYRSLVNPTISSRATTE